MASYEKIAKKHTREKKLIKIVVLCLLLILAITFITYAVSLLNQNMGGLTINLTYRGVDPGGLSLFERRTFINPTSSLTVAPLKHDMTNITYTWFGDSLPSIEDIDDIDGSWHYMASGSKEVSFLSYTFYVMNSTMESDITYSSSINLLSQAKGVAEAVRIIIVEDELAYTTPGNTRKHTIYGKKAQDGIGEDGSGLDPLTDIAFRDGKTIIYDEKTLKPGEAHKYTIILYLEGEDPECINDILGGMIRMSWDFLVIS
ncbi:MAG: hypothetical protein FWD49_03220 [Firmicutes bacterium]|nr:hypothetical protein [Bacillota bacterium]